jgi:siroheme synthase
MAPSALACFVEPLPYAICNGGMSRVASAPVVHYERICRDGVVVIAAPHDERGVNERRLNRLATEQARQISRRMVAHAARRTRTAACASVSE